MSFTLYVGTDSQLYDVFRNKMMEGVLGSCWRAAGIGIRGWEVLVGSLGRLGLILLTQRLLFWA